WRAFKQIVRVWVDLFSEHNLLTFASAIAFQALVAVVALLLLGVATLGEVGHEGLWTKTVGPKVQEKVLPDVFAGLDQTFERIFHTSSVGLIAFASAVAIWEVSGVVRACMGALSQVYGTEETRPWWIRFPLSIGLSVVLMAGLLGALLLSTIAKGAVHGTWGIPFAAARWLLAIAALAAAFGLLLRYAPAERRTKRWVGAGSILVVVCWIVQSLIFGLYVRDVADYRTAAGSLLGIYVLTSYLYVGAIVLLIGIELDELVRREVEGRAGPKLLQLAAAVIRG
ncbi:MAG TPA: YihY/virulence factor BrkB family protein, partial [Gaiellaceae bacterium]|nr:YihY/virulence factor BrkB family protein [Gaiellaceae bacterium]